MLSSGTLRRVDILRTDVSEERRGSIIRVTRIGELGTTLAVTSNRRTLRRNTMCSVLRLLVAAIVVPCHPDDGGATFLRNIGSYRSHKS
jgi:hypothetical protein